VRGTAEEDEEAIEPADTAGDASEDDDEAAVSKMQTSQGGMPQRLRAKPVAGSKAAKQRTAADLSEDDQDDQDGEDDDLEAAASAGAGSDDEDAEAGEGDGDAAAALDDDGIEGGDIDDDAVDAEGGDIDDDAADAGGSGAGAGSGAGGEEKQKKQGKLKGMTQKQLAKFKEGMENRGVVYLSRVSHAHLYSSRPRLVTGVSLLTVRERSRVAAVGCRFRHSCGRRRSATCWPSMARSTGYSSRQRVRTLLTAPLSCPSKFLTGFVSCLRADASIARKRKKSGGNTGKRFVDGWVEFGDKKVPNIGHLT
jgi:hypothetical protein